MLVVPPAPSGRSRPRSASPGRGGRRSPPRRRWERCWVVEGGGKLGFPEEPLSESGILGQLSRQDLDGRLPVEPKVVGGVDDAHPAPADDRLEAISGDLGSDAKVDGHCGVIYSPKRGKGKVSARRMSREGSEREFSSRCRRGWPRGRAGRRTGSPVPRAWPGTPACRRASSPHGSGSGTSRPSRCGAGWSGSRCGR